MKIEIAGFNVDYEKIKELCEKAGEDINNITPETISAAYARISRRPEEISELRKESLKEVEKARKTNETIVYDYGHGSIAEHVVFNIDLIGISRFAVEWIEKSRLCSFTEKSQRYVKFENDYYIPEEFDDIEYLPDSQVLKKEYIERVENSFKLYIEIFDSILKDLIEKNPNENKIKLENMAKEDARYVLPLCMLTQIGMTLNARNAEALIRRCLSSEYLEVVRIGEMLFEKISKIAPSLIKHTDISKFKKESNNDICDDIICRIYNEGNIDKILKEKTIEEIKNEFYENKVSLINPLEKLEYEKLIIYSFHSKLYNAFTIDDYCLNDLFSSYFCDFKKFDDPGREFELVDFTFEIEMSATCFAQFKRHRMMTLLSYGYNSDFLRIPVSFNEDMKNKFLELVGFDSKHVLENYLLIFDSPIEDYLLTNAHKRKIIVKVNARELYKMANLRLDEHAQWEIKEVVRKMVDQAKEVAPYVMMMAKGKSEF